MAKSRKNTAAKRRSSRNAVTNSPNPLLPGGKVDDIVVRMYCHGFGDCFLVTFRNNASPVYRMLIDCGMLTGDTARLSACIDQIKTECNNHLNLVVQTHEHKDHVSGFNLRDKQKKLLWDTISVDNVWLAWTENHEPGGDPLAKDLHDKFEMKKLALSNALRLYNQQIHRQSHKSRMKTESSGDEYYAAQLRYAKALENLLNFYDLGVDGTSANLSAARLTVDDAMSYFKTRANKPTISYWNPGDMADVAMTGLDGVRFYFLGPPKDYDLLKKMDDKEHVEMYLSDFEQSDNFYMALTETGDSSSQIPTFHPRYRLHKSSVPEKRSEPEHVWHLLHDKKHTWRNVLADWLHNAGILALHLDSYTNNTSLVIAIEFVDSGKVLLFPADAQIGNWISWTMPETDGSPAPKLKWTIGSGNQTEQVTAFDLLERTVFYKVGHHASHNATAKKHGLELMTSKELIAMIPVDEEVAKKQGKHGWKMPADNLYLELQKKTKGRIIRLDKGNILEDSSSSIPDGAKPTAQQRSAFNARVSKSTLLIRDDEGKNRPMFWEVVIKG